MISSNVIPFLACILRDILGTHQSEVVSSKETLYWYPPPQLEYAFQALLLVTRVQSSRCPSDKFLTG